MTNQTKEDNAKSYDIDLHVAVLDCLRDVAFQGERGNSMRSHCSQDAKGVNVRLTNGILALLVILK